MKIICAGYSKTGTKSMAAALRMLGFNVYDYAEHFLYHCDEWMKILQPAHKQHPNKTQLKEMLHKMYDDVDAVTDAPAYHLWEEILEAFPDSKVILVVRDENEWFESLTNFAQAIKRRTSPLTFLLNLIASASARKHLAFARCLFVEVFGSFPFPKNISHTLAIRRYRAHNSHVMQRCPEKSLLVFKLEDGWAPLCKFLRVPYEKILTTNGVTVSKSQPVPFPFKNAKSEGIKAWHDGKYPLPARIREEVQIFKQNFLLIMILCLVAYPIVTSLFLII